MIRPQVTLRTSNRTSTQSSISSLTSELSSKSRKLKLFNWFFSFICFIGAIYQISHIARIYFQYKTSSKIAIAIPRQHKLGPFSTCVRFTDILDYGRIQKDHPGRSEWKLTATAEGIRTYQKELTIKEIFNYTPKGESIINSMEFRRQNSYKLNLCNASDCLNYFEVNKFVYLEYVCYTITPKFINETLTYESLTISPSAPGEIFSLKLSPSMKKSESMKLLSHNTPTPYVTLPIVPVKKRVYSIETDTAKYNSFVCSAVKLNVTRLEPPYETQCVHYPHSRQMEIQKCIRSLVYPVLKKIPFSFIVNDSTLDDFLVSYMDTENETTTKLLFSAEHECMAKFSATDCNEEVSFTTSEAHLSEHFEVTLVTATSPFTDINSIKQTNLVEFITVVMSTASTWTGLAIVSFNPVLLFFTLRDKTNTIIRLMGFNSLSGKTSCSSMTSNNFKIQKRQFSNRRHSSVQFRTVDSTSLAYLMKYNTRQRELLQSIANIEYRIRKLEMVYVQRGQVRR